MKLFLFTLKFSVILMAIMLTWLVFLPWMISMDNTIVVLAGIFSSFVVTIGTVLYLAKSVITGKGILDENF